MKSTVILALLLVACSENQQARSFGGTMYVDLPCDQMLFDITWKTSDLWYATQPMPEGYEPRTTTFHEKKDGLSFYADGTVVLRETRCD